MWLVRWSRTSQLLRGGGCIVLLTALSAVPATAGFALAAAGVAEPAAIVVLGGSWRARTAHAAALYRAGRAPFVVLADDGERKGWSRQYQRNLSAIEAGELELKIQGVPRDAIIRCSFRKSGTLYDALAVKKVVLTRGFTRIFLVTSDYHAFRAQWTFHKVFRGLPVDIVSAPVSSPPQEYPFRLVELPKIIWYWLAYGLGTDPSRW